MKNVSIPKGIDIKSIDLDRAKYLCSLPISLGKNPDNDKDITRAKRMGIKDLNKKYDLNEIIKGDSIFCATGITSGDLVEGINIQKDFFTSETLVTHKSSGIQKVIKSKYKI